METIQIQKHAQMLYAAHGDKAELEAAQKAKKLEDEGKLEEAQSWRKVQEAINQMRGPHAS
jgi:hypothetical protein